MPPRLLVTPVACSVGGGHAIDLEVAFRTDIPGEAFRPVSCPLVRSRTFAALCDEPPAGRNPGAQIVGWEHDRPGPLELGETAQGAEEYRGTGCLSLQRRKPETLVESWIEDRHGVLIKGRHRSFVDERGEADPGSQFFGYHRANLFLGRLLDSTGHQAHARICQSLQHPDRPIEPLAGITPTHVEQVGRLTPISCNCSQGGPMDSCR